MLMNLIPFICLAVLLYLAILYTNTAVCAVFFFFCICLVFCMVQLFLTGRNPEIFFPEVIVDALGKKKVSFSFSVKWNGALPVFHGKAKFSLYDARGTKLYSASWDFRGNPDKHVVIPIELSGMYCGKFKLKLDYLQICSLFSLLHKRVRSKISAEVLFYPQISPLYVTVSEAIRYFSAESDESDDVLPGTPHAPMYQLREFQAGDKVRQIHWKLSARTDDLLVRDVGMPDGFPVLLFLQWKNADKKVSASRYSSFLEYAASLSFSLLEAKCSHFIIWYDSKKQSLVRLPIRTEEELDNCIYYLLYAHLQDIATDLYTLYTQKYPSDTYHCSLLLDTDLGLYKNRELLFSCSEKDWKKQVSEHSVDI